jgi:hypothetical protein
MFLIDPDPIITPFNLKLCEVDNDELYFSKWLPELTGRHSIAVGQAVVAHYAYKNQQEVLDQDDFVISKYAELANRLVL